VKLLNHTNDRPHHVLGLVIGFHIGNILGELLSERLNERLYLGNDEDG